MRSFLFLFMLAICAQSNAFEQRTVPVEKFNSLEWIRLSKMDEMAHANFCNASVRLKNENDAEGAQIVPALKSDKFCAKGDFDGDGKEDVALVYTDIDKEYPPCESLLVLGHKTDKPGVYRFVIEKAQSCNIQTFDENRLKALYGADVRCESPRAAVDSLVVYGEGSVTTLFTLDEERSQFATRECYGGAD